MNAKRHLCCVLLVAGALASPAAAQEPAVMQAQRLLSAGQVFAAMQVLELAPQTRETVEWRARVHLIRADQTQSWERCMNLRQALSLSGAASAGELVEHTTRAMYSIGCQPR
jgi:hypothetical protein